MNTHKVKESKPTKNLQAKRYDYLNEYFDMEIDITAEMHKLGLSKTMEQFIGQLNMMKRVVVNTLFAEDVELREMQEKLSRRGKAGRKKGKLKDPTAKQTTLETFRFKFPNSRDYDKYDALCDELRTPLKDRYTPESFRKILER